MYDLCSQDFPSNSPSFLTIKCSSFHRHDPKYNGTWPHPALGRADLYPTGLRHTRMNFIKITAFLLRLLHTVTTQWLPPALFLLITCNCKKANLQQTYDPFQLCFSDLASRFPVCTEFVRFTMC